MASYQETLEELSAISRLRNLRTLPNAGTTIVVDGKEYLSFSSNDYLSLAQDERVKSAAVEAVYKWGASASASRLVTGDLEIHSELEKELAEYLGQESSLVFGSGFLANVGVITSLAGRNDLIFSDRLNHASLVDGAVQSRAKVIRYKHNDTSDLRRLLESNKSGGERLIVSESVFSMDGDVAPVSELIEISNEFNATLILDEAHAVGVFGAGISSRVKNKASKFVIVGTLSKAFGSYGGFVACSREMRLFLINKARSFIFSTGLPPASCGAALESLRIFKNELELGARLMEKSRILYSALSSVEDDLMPFESQIIPVLIGSDKECVQVAQALYNKGIICSAIRPPTVPENTSRLRLSVNLNHTEEQLLQVANEIARLRAG